MHHIYIVDDDDPVRASLQSVLSTRPSLMVRGFRNGDEFLANLGRLSPGVVLLDVNMPGASGMDVLAALAGQDRTFMTIMITGQGNIALAVSAMKAGALDFIEKPFDHSALLATIETALALLQGEAALASRRNGACERIGRLSAREHDVLRGLIDGRPNKIIAHELGISPRTVEIHRANLMDKLDVRSLSEALRLAFAAGLM